MKNNFFTIARYWFVLFVVAIFLIVSCEKDDSLNIPEDQKDITVSHKKLKDIISGDDSKIWVTTPVVIPNGGTPYLDLIALSARIKPSPFFIGYEFNTDNTLKLYSTIDFGDLNIETTSKADNKYPDNPNTYRVGGNFRNEITIESKGLLSSLKRFGTMDFEYLVDSYSKDSISLKASYSEVLQKSFSMISYDKKEFLTYVDVSRKIFRRDIFSFSQGGRKYFILKSNAKVAKLTLEDKDGNEEVSLSGTQFESEDRLADIMLQYFDPHRRKFVYKFNEAIIEKINDRYFHDFKTFGEKMIEDNVKYFEIESNEDAGFTLKSYGSDQEHRIIVEF